MRVTSQPGLGNENRSMAAVLGDQASTATSRMHRRGTRKWPVIGPSQILPQGVAACPSG